MKLIRLQRILTAGALLFATAAAAEDAKPHTAGGCPLMGTKDCPMTAKAAAADGGDSHFDAVNRQGDAVMGFDHQRTTHHFTLWSDGGEIRVEANSAGDTASVALIRNHLKEIAGTFSDGDFSMPVQIHGKLPTGAATMKRLRTSIVYHWEATERGARVLILTRDRRAREAVHEFLRFQIADHRTGDPVTPLSAATAHGGRP